MKKQRIFIKNKWGQLKEFYLRQAFVNLITIILSSLAVFYAIITYNLTKRLGEDKAQINKLTCLVEESQKQSSLVLDQMTILRIIASKHDSTNRAMYALVEQQRRRVKINVSADVKKIKGKYYIERLCLENVGNIESEIAYLGLNFSSGIFHWVDSTNKSLNMFGQAYNQKDGYYSFNGSDKIIANVKRPVCIDLNNRVYSESMSLMILEYHLTYGNSLENNSIAGYVKVQLVKE